MTRTLDLLLTHIREEQDAVLIDLRQAIDYTDYFLVCTIRNKDHSKELVHNVKEIMRQAGIPIRIETDAAMGWVILDCGGDVMLHIFTPKTRMYYRLENLWSGFPQKRPTTKTQAA